jgi:putative Ig domain-containing protein
MRFRRILLFAALLALIGAPAALALRFTDASYFVPIGHTGVPYSHTFEIEKGGGSPPYKYLVLAGSLPPGLTLNSDSGLVSGVPTTTGEYSFWLEGHDCGSPCGFPMESAQRQFTIVILQGLLINQRQSVLTPALVNRAYSFQLTASGGGTPTWSVASGSLPAGLTLDSATGLISGTATQTGDARFQIKVADGNRSNVQTYTLPVVDPLAITSPGRAAARVRRAFTFQLTASGGRTPYTWAADGLPAGFTLDPSSGAITGSSPLPSADVVTVTVTDALGLKQTANVAFSVAARLAVVRSPLPAAKVGRRYAARMRSSGGVAPRSWRILGGRPGTLPPGIRFNGRTGVFSGTPTRAGTWRLRMQVTDGAGSHAAAGVVLRVLR